MTSLKGVQNSIAKDLSEIGSRGEPVDVTAPQPVDNSMFFRQGGGTVAVGVFCVVLMQITCSFGTSWQPDLIHEWFLLIVALMCLPFGTLLVAIGLVTEIVRTDQVKSGSPSFDSPQRMVRREDSRSAANRSAFLD